MTPKSDSMLQTGTSFLRGLMCPRTADLVTQQNVRNQRPRRSRDDRMRMSGESG